MSTNSLIGIEKQDGNVEYIYCHWDGYLSGNGAWLLQNYQDRTKVQALINLGDISSLGNTVEECVAYHRDRGEAWEDVKPDTVSREEYLKRPIDVPYLYLYDTQGRWHAWQRGTWSDDGIILTAENTKEE